MSDSTYIHDCIREKPLAWLEGEKWTPPSSRDARLETGALNVDWRIVVHLAKDFVVILDIFAKKTPRTPRSTIANCKRRLAAFRSAASTPQRTRT